MSDDQECVQWITTTYSIIRACVSVPSVEPDHRFILFMCVFAYSSAEDEYVHVTYFILNVWTVVRKIFFFRLIGRIVWFNKSYFIAFITFLLLELQLLSTSFTTSKNRQAYYA